MLTMDDIKKNCRVIFIVLFFFTLLRCHSKPEQTAMHFEVVNADKITDSLSAHLINYKEDFTHWKSVYEHCLHDTLFPDAFYLGLQNSMGIGSVSNMTVQNINGQITVLDTSGNRDILNIIAINNSANSFSNINLNKNLQDSFYNELIRNLRSSGNYAYLADAVDTDQIVFKITTLIDYAIRPDTLMQRLQQTKDSSLLFFRNILTTPGNALLVRSVMIFGFSSEFHLKRKLKDEEADAFKNQVYFKLGDAGGNGSIRLLSNQNLEVVINKNYTVFGQFYIFN
jgi:hypothetical protein